MLGNSGENVLKVFFYRLSLGTLWTKVVNIRTIYLEISFVPPPFLMSVTENQWQKDWIHIITLNFCAN
jgi:hypothetical protein